MRGKDLLQKFESQVQIEVVDLCIVRPTDIGFPLGWPKDVEQLFSEAKRFGFRPCPKDTPLVLREVWDGQPKGQNILVGTRPIQGSYFPVLISLGRSAHDEPCLNVVPIQQPDGIPDEYENIVLARI